MEGWQKIVGKSYFGSRPVPGQNFPSHPHITRILSQFNPGDDPQGKGHYPHSANKETEIWRDKSLTVTQLLSDRAGMQTWVCLTPSPVPLLEKQVFGHPGKMELSRGDEGRKE